MITMYDKDGNAIQVAREQVAMMEAAGYTLDQPAPAEAPTKKK